MSDYQFEAQGRKEIAEAVIIAALGAVCTGLINWGLDTLKAIQAKRQKPDEGKP